METNARYVLIGLFTLLVSGAVFVFVYWIHNTGGLGERALYRVRFEGSVAGLLRGSSVLFNGIRVGDVAKLDLDRANPRRVTATISVEPATPVRADTQVAIETRGLTGAPTILLTGGASAAPALPAAADGPPILAAEPGAGQDFMQAARDAIRRLDGILAENSQALHQTIANLSTFTDALARNSGRVDTILAGLERMTGGAAPGTPPPLYDLSAVTSFPPFAKESPRQLAGAEATAPLVVDTQRILLRNATGEIVSAGNGQWSDGLPKLFQAKIVQSFENAKFLRGVGAPTEGVAADFKLLIEIRSFLVIAAPSPSADVEFAAKLVAEDGHIAAQHIFHATAPAPATDIARAAAALNEAFGKAVTELVLWTADTI